MESLSRLTTDRLQSVSGSELGELLLAMHEMLPLPVLTQLEQGQVDGLTVKDTEELKRKTGWSSYS